MRETLLFPQALYIVRETLLFSQGLSERDIIVCSGPYIVRETLLDLVWETLKEIFYLKALVSTLFFLRALHHEGDFVVFGPYILS